MTFLRGDEDEINENRSLTRFERNVLASLLAVVAVFTVVDVYEDFLDGSPLTHIVPEVLTIFALTGVAIFLLRRFAISRREVIQKGRAEVDAAKKEAINWQQQASNLKHGVSDAISKQLSAWGLTQAEQDISFLILKGLSIKEIAEVRHTSERTIRQQASEVYRKSGLTGRAQLSAFFLEDLFS